MLGEFYEMKFLSFGTTGPPGGNPLGLRDALAFCLVAATSALIVEGYNYSLAGTDQIQQIPLILRALDPSFLEHDFFINSSMAFGPRYFYIGALGFLAGIIPLPVLMLFLTWACYLAVALITFFAARRIFAGDDTAAMLACVLVFGVESLMIGENGHLLEPYLIPRMAARPLILLGFWLGLSGRPLACGPVIALAALIHPLESVGAGLIALGAEGAVLLGGLFRSPDKRSLLLGLIKTGATALGLAAFIYLVFLSRQNQSLDDASFIHYWAAFRHPHHYIPSTWPLVHFLAGAAFAAALALSLRWGVQDGRLEPELARKSAWVMAAVAGLCLGGYLFVEIFPSRIWTMAQTYRFLFVLKWLGLIIMAGTAAAAFRDRERSRPEKLPGLVVLAGSYQNQPFMLLWGHLLELVRRLRGKPLPALWLGLWGGAGLAGAGFLMAGFGFRYREMFKVLLFAGMTLWFALVPKSRIRAALPLAGAAVLAAIGLWGPWPGLALKWNEEAAAHLGPPDEMAHFAARPGDFAPPPALSRWVRQNTGPREVFIAPPMFGKFRISARRAVVVDFKCIPYTDSAILEWSQRLEDCYGPVRSAGFAAVTGMEEQYKKIDDARLAALAARYGASYAVLFSPTETAFSVLYDRGRYKIVRLPAL